MCSNWEHLWDDVSSSCCNSFYLVDPVFYYFLKNISLKGHHFLQFATFKGMCWEYGKGFWKIISSKVIRSADVVSRDWEWQVGRAVGLLAVTGGIILLEIGLNTKWCLLQVDGKVCDIYQIQQLMLHNAVAVADFSHESSVSSDMD